MKSTILGALLFLSGCATYRPCPAAYFKTQGLRMRGRPAHVCSCRLDSKGDALIDECLDAPLAPPKSSVPVADCVTACGLRAHVSPEICQELNHVEADTLRAYSARVEAFRPGYAACTALDGYHIKFHPHDLVQDSDCSPDAWHVSTAVYQSGCVIGLTHFQQGEIEISNDQFRINAFAHEVGHVLDKEFGTGARTSGHCGWAERGFDQAIQDVTGEREHQVEDCD
jgi:hypothetical protein